MLDIAYHAGFKTLVLTVSDMTDLALSVLNAPTVKEKIRAIVVKAPSSMQDVRRSALEDLGVLTGATPLRHETSDTLTAIRLEQIGRARRIWADENFFGVVGGQGDPRKLREHIARLRSAYLGVDDRDDRKKLLDRIGRLMGGSATLWVGDVTLSAIESRKVLAQRTTEAMRGAMREGVVPGAGVALLDSRSVLQAALKQTSDPDERVAYRILLRALQEPLRVLLENAGLDAKEVMAKIELAGPGHGYDVLAGKLVQVDQSGLVDSAAVVRNALFGAVHGAALLLVTDVIVHIKNPADGSQTT
jgi:chaperonin GroEL